MPGRPRIEAGRALHGIECLAGDALHGATPSGVHVRHHRVRRIDHRDGKAICNLDTEGDVIVRGPQRVARIALAPHLSRLRALDRRTVNLVARGQRCVDPEAVADERGERLRDFIGDASREIDRGVEDRVSARHRRCDHDPPEQTLFDLKAGHRRGRIVREHGADAHFVIPSVSEGSEWAAAPNMGSFSTFRAPPTRPDPSLTLGMTNALGMTNGPQEAIARISLMRDRSFSVTLIPRRSEAVFSNS